MILWLLVHFNILIIALACLFVETCIYQYLLFVCAYVV